MRKTMTTMMVVAMMLAGVCGLAACGAASGERGAAKPSGDAVDAAPLLPPPVDVVARPIPGFMRGINIGNALDAPTEGAWGVHMSEKHFEMAAAAGLDHVRLPVRFSVRAETEAPFTIDPAFFERVDWAVEKAHAHKLSIIIDVHHYEEIMKNPAAHEERLLAMWKQIAERYRDEPQTVAFEILNEPSDKLDPPSVLNPLMKKAVEAVRESNPERLIFVNCAFWANIERLHELDLSWADDQVIASVHMYQPILFTHQGADWMGPLYAITGVVFPGPPAEPVSIPDALYQEDWVANWFSLYNTLPAHLNPCGPKTVYGDFDRVTAYVKQHDRRIYLGEFGAVDKIDEVSRETYIRMVRTEAERRGLGRAYWDDGCMNRGRIVHTGEWVPVIQRALFND